MKPQWVIVQFLIMLGWAMQAASAQPIDPKVLHVVNRISFGARPGDYERVQKIGVDRYVQEQLNPDKISEPQALLDRLAQLSSLEVDTGDQVQLFRSPPDPNDPNAKQKVIQETGQVVLRELTQARLLRAIDSPRQLEEVMTDFWFNHFNVHSGKGRTKLWLSGYERDAIRPYALGKFRDLLDTTARHPAMLYYLDNWQNRSGALNENYARELMELHTLGVDGGYSQADVVTLAKVLTGWGIAPYNKMAPIASGFLFNPKQQLTGWGIAPYNKMAPIASGFLFNPKQHDNSTKVFLGKTLTQKGEDEGAEVLDILASQPGTAKFISFKLAQYFVSDKPPQSLVNRLQKRFIETDGDIRQVLQTLFSSSEFLNPKIYRRKYKTPYQYVVSAVRSTGVNVLNTLPLSNTLNQLSMPIYGCPTPDGYKQIESNWLNPDSTVRRLNFAVSLGNGSIAITIPANSKIKVMPLEIGNLNQTIGPVLKESTQQKIQSQPANLRTGLMLGSPEFMYR